MKNQNYLIGLLAITATLLLTACLFVKTQQPAQGAFSIKDRDYIATTSPLQRGGDALYITDIRTGQMVVFIYDPATRALQVGAMLNVANLFGPGR